MINKTSTSATNTVIRHKGGQEDFKAIPSPNQIEYEYFSNGSGGLSGMYIPTQDLYLLGILLHTFEARYIQQIELPGRGTILCVSVADVASMILNTPLSPLHQDLLKNGPSFLVTPQALEFKPGYHMSIGEFSAVYYTCFQLGRNRMFSLLRDMKVIQRGNTLPAQRWIDKGYFQVIQTQKDGLTFPQSVLTPKGREWLPKEIHDYFSQFRP